MGNKKYIEGDVFVLYSLRKEVRKNISMNYKTGFIFLVLGPNERGISVKKKMQ